MPVYPGAHEDYQPLTAVRAGLPMELEVFVGKCLQKEAGKRYPSAGDLAVDLASLSEQIKSGRSTIGRSVPGLAATRQSRSRTPWLVAAAAALAAFAVGALLFHSQPSPSQTYQFEVLPPRGGRFDLPETVGLG